MLTIDLPLGAVVNKRRYENLPEKSSKNDDLISGITLDNFSKSPSSP